MFKGLITLLNASIKDIDSPRYVVENSWYLKEQGIHHFFCVCGNHDSIGYRRVKNPYLDRVKFKKEEVDFRKIPNIYHPDNRCSKCGNERYLDINALLFDSKTRFWTEIEWGYEEKLNGNSWGMVAFMHIPRFKYEKNAIVIEKIELSEFTVGYDGEQNYVEKLDLFLTKQMVIDGKYYQIRKLLKKRLTEKIVALMILNPLDSFAWLDGEEQVLENLIFFLKNPKIRFKDILYWQDREMFLEIFNECQYLEESLEFIRNFRQEKSLKKVQLKSYKKMIALGGYSPIADYIFTRTIDDVNQLIKVLDMDVDIKMQLLNDYSHENINYFIDSFK
jgi:hypothetical protein